MLRLWLLVSQRFQVLFHSPPGVLFIFPSRYFFTIGRYHVFSLGRWSSRIPAGFHVSHGTQVLTPRRPRRFVYGALTLSGNASQRLPLRLHFLQLRGPSCADPESALQPPCRNDASLSHDTGLCSSHFARRYYGNHSCFLFLQVLRWFSSLGFPSTPYVFRCG